MSVSCLVGELSCSHAPPPLPNLQGRVRDSQAKVQVKYFFVVPAVQRKWQGFDTKILTPGRFSLAKGRAKSIILTSSLSPRGGVYSRALETEKS